MISDVETRLTEVPTLDYEEYLSMIKEKVEMAEQGLKTFDKIEQIKLNYHRNNRLSKTYKVSPDLEMILKSINLPQTWYLLTEDWCGDSNQMLPCLAKMTRVNPDIQLKIILRDNNPEIMEQYLTDGKRSIPKLISVDSRGRELFTWGPRPQPAQKLFEGSLALDPSKDKAKARLHAWYGKDSCRTLETEMAEKLKKIYR